MAAVIENEVDGAAQASVVTPMVGAALPRHLVSKGELAEGLSVSERTIENWTAAKRIPYLRLSPRMNRYSLPRVLEALAKYEVREAGAKR
jgi:hypothetical protein